MQEENTGAKNSHSEGWRAKNEAGKEKILPKEGGCGEKVGGYYLCEGRGAFGNTTQMGTNDCWEGPQS